MSTIHFHLQFILWHAGSSTIGWCDKCNINASSTWNFPFQDCIIGQHLATICTLNLQLLIHHCSLIHHWPHGGSGNNNVNTTQTHHLLSLHDELGKQLLSYTPSSYGVTSSFIWSRVFCQVMTHTNRFGRKYTCLIIQCITSTVMTTHVSENGSTCTCFCVFKQDKHHKQESSNIHTQFIHNLSRTFH